MYRPLTSILRSRGFCLAHVGILPESLAQGSLAALSAYNFSRWRTHMARARGGMNFVVEHRVGFRLDWAGKAPIRGCIALTQGYGTGLGSHMAAGGHMPGIAADPLGDSSQPRSA